MFTAVEQIFTNRDGANSFAPERTNKVGKFVLVCFSPLIQLHSSLVCVTLM